MVMDRKLYWNNGQLNDKGERHGYFEIYFCGQLRCKGVFVNGKDYGYFECYDEDGSVAGDYTGYFFDGNKISDNNEEGHCLIWDKVVV